MDFIPNLSDNKNIFFRSSCMKKLYMVILATLSVILSAIGIGDWERNYDATNSCNTSIQIFHELGRVGLIDGSILRTGKFLSLENEMINGCLYNVYLDSNVSQDDFEDQMLASGITVVNSGSLPGRSSA